MDGLNYVSTQPLPTASGLARQLATAANFSGDSYPDLVWRNTSTGANEVWRMSGATSTQTDLLDSEADLGWNIVPR
jgi:hypothetical protein